LPLGRRGNGRVDARDERAEHLFRASFEFRSAGPLHFEIVSERKRRQEQRVRRNLPAGARQRSQSIVDDPSTPATASRQSAPRSARLAQLVDATLNHRRAIMRYHSFSSDREKDYQVEPYRLVFAQGGFYLVAYVPEYNALRTFAVDRIQSLSLTEERFEPVDLPADAFENSLGVNQGAPERIEIAFEPRIARHIRERVWHASQHIEEAADGKLTMTLNVCNDVALRSWILGFGPSARVISPPELVRQIQDEADKTRLQYAAIE